MKKILMALVATLTMAFAGGDIAPVAQVAPDASTSGFYVTGKLGAGQTFKSSDWDYFSDGSGNNVYSMLGLGLGYRYTITPEWFVDGEFGIYTSFYGEDGLGRTDYDFSVRPGYVITPEWEVYGILAETYTKIQTKGHDWTTGVGAGVGYNLTKNLKVTAEYQYQIQDFNGYNNVKNDRATIGLRYSF
jgi:opacity protein-like surface antigen